MSGNKASAVSICIFLVICMEFGSGEVFFRCAAPEVQKMTTAMQQCAGPLMQSFNQNSVSFLTGNIQQNLISDVCKKIQGLLTCMNQHFESSQCFGPKFTRLISNITEGAKSATRYICAKDGQAVKDFFKYDGITCLQTAGKRMQECQKKTTDSFKGKDIMSESESSIINKICSVSMKQENCAMNILKETKECKPQIIKMYREMTMEMNNKVYCLKGYDPNAAGLVSDANKVVLLSSMLFIVLSYFF